MKKKILYIINPFSGSSKKNNLEQIIGSETDKSRFELFIKHTEYAGHGKELARQAIEDKLDIVVAVGGDGTINEISSQLINTDIVFAIIPKGSGNGLARFLNIPLDEKKAVRLINKMNVLTIDSIKLNDLHYVNMAGIGFDAHIAHLFSTFGKRGFKSYVKLVYKEYKKYKSQNYLLTIDGKQIEQQAFVISFANSSQFGNNAHIAPLAKINDGLIDLCILKEFPAYKAISLVYQLYTKRLPKSRYYKVHKAKHIQVKSETELLAHIDGEPIKLGNNLDIKILPKSLKIICPLQQG
jgi:YegS/Rv2252/BmrU family lipid kinase